MITIGKLIVRFLFIICVIILLTSDYSALLNQLLGGNRTEPRSSRNAPRAANPGYGDITTDIDLDADIEDDHITQIGSPMPRYKIALALKYACLPKLICELNATPEKDKLTESEKSLLALIRDSSLSTMAEITKYHFAAHMGQLISGVDGNGCHNFYPSCPIPGLQVLQMMKKEIESEKSIFMMDKKI